MHCSRRQWGWPQGEKIFVAVRVRPLNEKEIARSDLSDWDCVNHDTIVYKNTIPERSPFPSAFRFDRVFGCDTSTRQVYEEAAKEVALSVLTGFNSGHTVFPCFCGKTYTMRGITDCAVTDIYQYIEKRKEREFSPKFSAMEIYNEAVRDLLSGDGSPLRLLDDPERGTVVKGLVEESLRDWHHLKELLSVCEAQRQIGETSLNETSSRSHQIIRLTVESCPSEFLGVKNPSALVATVNFVDLAGSEHASRSLSAGSRLKEGCHINHSLLTLGTVVRKLSKGKNGHITYRNSKLTRILQSSLGGNSRTAIICTISPSRTHVEQSKNTLFFASCAKKVSTCAQANLVKSDKLWFDFGQISEPLVQNAWVDECSVSELPDMSDPTRPDVDMRSFNTPRYYGTNLRRKPMHHFPELLEDSEDQLPSDDNSSKLSVCNFSYVGPDCSQSSEYISQRRNDYSEDLCKEVRCVEMEDSSIKKKRAVNNLSSDPEANEGTLALTVNGKAHETLHLRPRNRDYHYGSLKRERDIPTFDSGFVNVYPLEPSLLPSQRNQINQAWKKMHTVHQMGLRKTSIADQSAFHSHLWIYPLLTIVEPYPEKIPNLLRGFLASPLNWASEFERQRRAIIELWHACNAPLVHRTVSFLLFKGDPSDSVYLEVELRRYLKDLNHKGEEASVSSPQTGMNHIKENAAIVAKLDGLKELGQARKEMFGFTFAPSPVNRSSFPWKHRTSSVM
ncbi:Kinesin motor domain [Dillenia turbinata]|uniref:Kinesin-like protein n=1 Tax=Dillenia turbinata TaxID=194707 RepID=A0AAN8VZZ0_9MAGN